MKTLGLEIAIIIALAVINGIFAMSEVALLSAVGCVFSTWRSTAMLGHGVPCT